MISDKVRPHHLERKAILYVRQSSAQQVLHNRESSALQYAMRDRLTALGWSEIEVIDDDLGRSAAGGVQRIGQGYISETFRHFAAVRKYQRLSFLQYAFSTSSLSCKSSNTLGKSMALIS